MCARVQCQRREFSETDERRAGPSLPCGVAPLCCRPKMLSLRFWWLFRTPVQKGPQNPQDKEVFSQQRHTHSSHQRRGARGKQRLRSISPSLYFCHVCVSMWMTYVMLGLYWQKKRPWKQLKFSSKDVKTKPTMIFLLNYSRSYVVVLKKGNVFYFHPLSLSLAA